MNRKKALGIVVVTFLITSLVLAIVQPGLIRQALSTASLEDSKYQQVDYATNKRGTFINVPLDSRPIGRESIENLAIAAGYDYLETDSGLDSAKGDDYYHIGDPTTIQNDLRNLVRTRNNSNTTVVINTSSYFHGGLVANRTPDSYEEKDEKISALKSLLSSYRQPKYYVIMQIPRTISDKRVLPLPNGITSDTKVDGLATYYAKANKQTANQVTFEQALLDWTYLYYAFENEQKALPQDSYVRSFYQDFRTKYAGYLTDYLDVFKNSYTYLNELYRLKNQSQYKNFTLVVASDYYVTSDFINHNVGRTGFSWIKTNSDGKTAIPYSGTYYLANFAESYPNMSTIVSGSDTTTYLVLAADLIRKNGTGIYFSARDPINNGGWNGISATTQGFYDRKNRRALWEEKTAFINGNSKDQDLSAELYILDSKILGNLQTGYADTITENVWNQMQKQKNTPIGVVDLSGKFNDTIFHQFLKKSSSSQTNIYDLAYLGGLYSTDNAFDIALATSSVAAVLQSDMNKASSVNTFSQKRVDAFAKTKLTNVLRDVVYGSKIRDSGDFQSNLSNRVIYSNGVSGSGTNLLTMFLSKDYAIGNYHYSYQKASVTASSPWSRAYEVKISPTLTNLSLKKDQLATNIRLNRSNLQVTSYSLGDTYKLKATITPSDAINQEIVWKSSRPSVASVDETGLVTYEGIGTATITASTDNGKKATCTVTISDETDEIPVSSISLNRSTLNRTTANIGETYRLTATVYPTNATTQDLYWDSSNPSVASVNSSGTVTFRGVGTATITVASNNGKMDTCEVRITKESNTISVPEITIDNYSTDWTNQDMLISMTVTDSINSIASVTVNGEKMTSSNNRYSFYAKNNGSYTIQALNTQGSSASKVIHISNIDKTLPSITVSGDNQLYEGNTIYVTIQANDAESQMKTVTVNGKEIMTSASTVRYPVNAPGRYTIIATDYAGNARTTYFTITEKEQETDVTPPTLTVTGAPTTWTNQDVVLTIQATDAGSGIKSVTVDGKEISIQNGIGRYTVTKNGTYVFVATDNNGNTYTHRLTISMINKLAPTIANIENNKVYDKPVRPQVGSSASGIQTVILKKDGSVVSGYTMGDTISENGSYELSITDYAGNTKIVQFKINKKDSTVVPDDDKNNNTNHNNNNSNTNNNNSNTNDDKNHNGNTNTNQNNSNSGTSGSTNRNNSLTIGGGNTNTNTNISGTTNGGNNKPSSTTGNLDSSKASGRIPQTGDFSLVDAILLIGCILLAPISIISFRRYRKNSQ